MRILLFLSMLATLVQVQDTPSSIKLHEQSKCGYQGIIYKVPRPMSVMPRFGFGDITPSPFDTDIIRTQVVRLIVASGQPRRNEMDSSAITSADIVLSAEYHFPNSPNFVLLKYQTRLANADVFFGYSKSSGKAYLLGPKGRGLWKSYTLPLAVGIQDEATSLESDFWQMLVENPGIFNEPPLCTAALLVLLKYYSQTSPLLVLDNYQDALAALALLHGMGDQAALRQEVATFDDLYLFHLSKDSVLARYSTWREEYSGTLKLVSSLRYQDSIIYSPPEILESGDTIKISMSACGGDTDGLRRCEILLLKNGIPISVRTNKGPFCGPAYGLRHLMDCPPFGALRGWFCLE